MTNHIRSKLFKIIAYIGNKSLNPTVKVEFSHFFSTNATSFRGKTQWNFLIILVKIKINKIKNIPGVSSRNSKSKIIIIKNFNKIFNLRKDFYNLQILPSKDGFPLMEANLALPIIWIVWGIAWRRSRIHV